MIHLVYYQSWFLFLFCALFESIEAIGIKNSMESRLNVKRWGIECISLFIEMHNDFLLYGLGWNNKRNFIVFGFWLFLSFKISRYPYSTCPKRLTILPLLAVFLLAVPQNCLHLRLGRKPDNWFLYDGI